MIRKIMNRRITLRRVMKQPFSMDRGDFDQKHFLENIKDLEDLEESEEDKPYFFHYKVLDLPKMASHEEIKVKFRTISTANS